MKPDYLSAWLRDSRTRAYFGGTFQLRADVLGALLVGGNLSEIARRHGVSKQAAHRHAVDAKRFFFVPDQSTKSTSV